jgi:hypothetical protein
MTPCIHIQLRYAICAWEKYWLYLMWPKTAADQIHRWFQDMSKYFTLLLTMGYDYKSSKKPIINGIVLRWLLQTHSGLCDDLQHRSSMV